MPIEAEQPGKDPKLYVPMEPISDAIAMAAQAESMQFQRVEGGYPPHFFAKADVGGFLRRKSSLYTKTGVDGKETNFIFLVLDVGPVYPRTRDPERKRIRNVMTCTFFGPQARRLDRELTAIHKQVFSQLWINVKGKVENRFRWVDKGDLTKGKKPTGEMQIAGETFFIPPIPKLTQVRPKYREEGFPDAPEIRV